MIPKLEQDKLLILYEQETGNSIEGNHFKLSEYLDWLEKKVLTLLNCEK